MLHLDKAAQEYFKPYYQSLPGSALFFYYNHQAGEYWSPIDHRIPVTTAVWMAGVECKTIVTDLYISYSAAELISFASLRQGLWPEQRAYAALGLLPSPKQAQYLKNLFPHARWHMLFGSDLLGKIADASMAAWRKGHPLSFRVSTNRLSANYRSKLIEFDMETFSLSRFERMAGLRAEIRTHKPPKGYVSFMNLLSAHANDSRSV